MIKLKGIIMVTKEKKLKGIIMIAITKTWAKQIGKKNELLTFLPASRRFSYFWLFKFRIPKKITYSTHVEPTTTVVCTI